MENLLISVEREREKNHIHCFILLSASSSSSYSNYQATWGTISSLIRKNSIGNRNSASTLGVKDITKADEMKNSYENSIK